jgi:hypothetical protein
VEFLFAPSAIPCIKRSTLSVASRLSVASLVVFRGAPKRALFEAYLNPTQFEDSKAVRGELACHFSCQPSSLL